MISKWDGSGFGVESKWTRSEERVRSKWYRKWKSKRDRSELEVGPKWSRSGPRVNSKWLRRQTMWHTLQWNHRELRAEAKWNRLDSEVKSERKRHWIEMKPATLDRHYNPATRPQPTYSKRMFPSQRYKAKVPKWKCPDEFSRGSIPLWKFPKPKVFKLRCPNQVPKRKLRSERFETKGSNQTPPNEGYRTKASKRKLSRESSHAKDIKQ